MVETKNTENLAGTMDIKQMVKTLDAKQVRFIYNDFGEIEYSPDNSGHFQKVKVIQSFPISKPFQFISIRNEIDEEIGLIENAHDLERTSFKIMCSEIDRSYFVPKIIRILYISPEEPGKGSVWEVETDHGSHVFEMFSHSDILSLESGQVLIKDLHGNRYEIPNRFVLDRQSQCLLDEDG